MAFLEVFDRKETRRIRLKRKITSVGRGKANQVRVAGDDVADQHAHIVSSTKGGYRLSSLGGHPLEVNGEAVNEAALSDGDEFFLGDAKLVFHEGDPEAPSDEAKSEAFSQLMAFTRQLADEEDPESLLAALVDLMMERTGATRGFVLMEEDGRARIRTARGVDGRDLDQRLEKVPDCLLDGVRRERKPLLVLDAQNSPEFKTSTSVVRLGVASVLVLPLLVRGRLLGMLYLGADSISGLVRAYSVEVLAVFAAQAALLLGHALETTGLKKNLRDLQTRLAKDRLASIVGASRAMERVFRLIDRVAASDLSVLILGETGTGKELVARRLHEAGDRRGGPFVVINCAAIPETLLESELFGYRKGAFTGADEDREGKFAAARGGTLFLDEIGDMALALQAKLLRVLQERTVTPVGGNKPVDVEFRLVCATHQSLTEGVSSGKFRQDLFYRVNEVIIPLPPLRDRGEDVILLARHFLQEAALRHGGPTDFSAGAEAALLGHDWPGNIRELENTIKRACVFASSDTVEVADLGLGGPAEVSEGPGGDGGAEEPGKGALKPLADAVKDFQERYVVKALDLCDGNRKAAASLLGVDPRTLFRYLRKMRQSDEP